MGACGFNEDRRISFGRPAFCFEVLVLEQAGEERALRSRRCERVSDAIVACTTPDMFTTPRTQQGFARVRDRVRLVRWGGDCYAYCLLAMGLIDVVVESSLQAWDVQALIPIVEAAGGRVTNWQGGPCNEGGPVLACGDPALHKTLIRRLTD